MARPQRNNVDYFPFLCEEGKKMFYLEETYGNDGFAVFVKLLRELAKTDFHYLDLSKNTTLMFLSAKCKVSKEILLSIINDLAELEKFDSILWNENQIIWCQDFIDSIQDAYGKRNNKCITYEGLLTLLTSLGVRKPSKSKSKEPVNPQSIVEYSKEDKSILNNSIDILFKDLNINNSLKEKILEYIDYRKEIKKPLKSEKSIIALIKKLSSDSDAIEKINQTIENGWQGLFDLKEKPKNQNCNSKYNIKKDAHLDPKRLVL